MTITTPRLPRMYEVIITLTLFLVIMTSSIVFFDIPLQLSLLTVWFLFILLGMILGHTYIALQKSIALGIYEGIEAALVLVVVGGLIGTWIAGGIVPSMIYYGLAIIHPNIFLLATLLVCALTSLMVGTSWGTAGTVGIAMMAVGYSFGMPLPLVAAVVISGATFGDKMSPLSDTTVLTASLSKVSVMAHVRSMLTVGVPAFIVSGILFTIVGLFYVDKSVDMSVIETNMANLKMYFNIGWYMFIPPFIILILLILKKPAIPTIAFGAVLGAIWAWLFQDMNFSNAIVTAYEGYSLDTGIEFIDGLFNNGGILSMLNVILFVILALGFGGLLEKTGVLTQVSEALSRWVKESTGRLTLSTLITAFFGNLFGSANYVAIITGTKMTEKNYDKLHVDRTVLSRNTETGGTLTGAMVPWTENGIFYPAILGVATFSYVPYMWLGFSAIIISIIYGYTGKFIWRTNEKVGG